MAKLLIIGFDGMDYFMARNTIGKYPFKNVRPVLRSLLPEETYTGPSWASFYTGLSKTMHGVVDKWGRIIEGSNSYVEIRDYVFWNIIEGSGYSVYTDSLPVTPSGFPFAYEKEKDMVNWDRAAAARPGLWRDKVRHLDFNDVISELRTDSINLIDKSQLINKDLVFIQFNFLDRIGHIYTFNNNAVMNRSYSLAYEIIDRLYELTTPQHLIVVSDHGFWKRLFGHRGANCAVVIVNDEAHRFFAQYRLFKRFYFPFYLFTNVRICENIRMFFRPFKHIVDNLSFSEILQFFFRFNYVRQVDIFDAILKMFDISYEKPKQRIQKKQETGKVTNDDKVIEERLRRLGYL
jgi:hypothetical protein